MAGATLSHRYRGWRTLKSSVLDRYLLREMLGPFLSTTVTLLSLFYAMVLVRGVDFLLGSAARAIDWLMLAGAMLPMLLPQVLPLSLLLGVMIGLARLGEDGELIAMASLGLSPRRLARPVLTLSFGVASLLGLTGVFWKPWGMIQMRQTAREVIERNILSDLKPGTLHTDLPGIVFRAEEISSGPQWKRVLLIDERDPDRTSVLWAPWAEGRFDQGVGLRLSDGVLVQRGAPGVHSTTSFREGTMLFNVADALRRRDTFRFGHQELSMLELLAAARQAESNAAPAQAFWSAFHFRLSELVAPFALGLLATALGQGARRRAPRAAALMALGVYLAYYVISRVGVQLGERGLLAPSLAGHLPTVVAFLIGALMLERLARRGAR